MKSFSVFISIMFILSSCIPETVQPDDVTGPVDECLIIHDGKEVEELVLEYEAAMVDLKVTSNVSWSIKAEDSSWISFSRAVGDATEEGYEVLMTVKENTLQSERRTVVLLKAGSAEKRMNVTQNPYRSEVHPWETSNEAIANMGVGWNLGNTLDADSGAEHDGADWRYWETCWGQPVTSPELMVMMKNAGFGAMRIPVTWRPHMTSDGTVMRSWMTRVREVVDYVLNAGMYCIINVHHDTGAGDNVWLQADPDVYQDVKERYGYLWKQIAEEFRDYDHRLLFESYNEMLDSRKSWCFASFNGSYDESFALDAYEAINDYAQCFVDAVRSTGGNNSVRNLIVNTYGACNGDGDWNPHLQDPLKYMELPSDRVKDHLIFEVHAYPMIDDMEAMPSATQTLFSRLNEMLASKGAPVIMGEWGTFSDAPPMSDLLTFADCFVRTAKDYGIGTFYWMGLSDGLARQFPAFSMPEMAQSIVSAYHGSSSSYSYPTVNDFNVEYVVTYDTQWSELNLVGREISLDEYSGIAFELAEMPADGMLAVKVYGETEGIEQYSSFDRKDPVISFDRSVVGQYARRVTLQFMKNGSFSTVLKNVELVRHDGTREKVGNVSVFWGCSVELVVSPKR